MPVLPYCVVLADEKIAPVSVGVEEASVESAVFETLRILYSHVQESVLSPESVRFNALAFHRVISSVFRSAALVPFRFPNLLDDDEQLRQHVEANLARYSAFLEKTRHAVQMEIVLSQPSSPTAAGGGSGTEYLRAKQETQRANREIASSVREQIADLSLDWKLRESRIYVLVPRSRADEIRGCLKDVANVRISGPWPASEFLD